VAGAITFSLQAGAPALANDYWINLTTINPGQTSCEVSYTGTGWDNTLGRAWVGDIQGSENCTATTTIGPDSTGAVEPFTPAAYYGALRIYAYYSGQAGYAASSASAPIFYLDGPVTASSSLSVASSNVDTITTGMTSTPAAGAATDCTTTSPCTDITSTVTNTAGEPPVGTVEVNCLAGYIAPVGSPSNGLTEAASNTFVVPSTCTSGSVDYSGGTYNLENGPGNIPITESHVDAEFTT
jgi:hypothetical protein